MPQDLPGMLQRWVDSMRQPVLLVHDGPSRALAASLGDVRLVDAERPVRGRPGKDGPPVLCLMSDAAALRRVLPGVRGLGRTRDLSICFREATSAIVLRPPRDWPAIRQMSARLLPTGEALTVLRLTSPVAAIEALDLVAVDVSAARPAPARVVTVRNGVGEGRLRGAPPDAVVRRTDGEAVPDYSLVRGRPPIVVTDPDLADGPLDEGSLNPIGFIRDPSRGPARLWTDATSTIRLDGVPDVGHVDPVRGATARLVALLRDHDGVHVSWDGAGPEVSRVVAGLAMAGVPVQADPAPSQLERRVGPALCRIMAQSRPQDRLEREELSVRLRREALLTHSRPAWRTRAARASGGAVPLLPSCSVVLATRRPTHLEFTLGQINRQRGVETELVLVAHDFSVDADWLRERFRGPCTTLSMPASANLGEVLNAGAQRAAGDVVVKMDDDDYYGPDFLLDLLLARHYSTAEVVGAAGEFIYFPEEDRTVRRQHASETFSVSVAGGALTIGREHLREVGGFRSIRIGEVQVLCNDVRALGGSVYRGHGLGYLRRRSRSGHTWNPGGDHFLTNAPADARWDGFRPSRLMEVDEDPLRGVT